MTPEHEYTVRIAMAVALTAIAIASFVWPNCFFGVPGILAGAKRSLSPSQLERLRAAISARRDAEGISQRGYGRLFTVMCLAAAAAEFVPPIPFFLPYALVCLAIALVTYLAYIQFRRALDRRVAPLERRSVFAALPVWSILAMLGALVASLTLAADPELRAGALLVAAATLLLGFTAWRIAVAPSLLLGEDPQVEYAVDRRMREGRATGTAVLACGPIVLFAAFAATGNHAYATFAQDLSLAAMAVALVANIIPLTKRLAFT
jgi:hypothetical protein